MAALADRAVPAVQLDVSLLERTPYALTDEGVVLSAAQGDVMIPADGPVRGWLRRLAPPDWRREVAPSSHAGAVRASWIALLVGIAHACAINWLSEIERLFIAENKVAQWAVARALGIATPSSAVVSERSRIPSAMGERLVAKPLGPGQFEDRKGRALAVFASDLTRDAPELEALAGAPFLIQELLEAETHLRIATVVERTWVCALDAEGLPADWRRVDRAHDAFEPSHDYGDVAAAAVELTKKLGVRYSSQDWVIARGESYFLDLNPGGQWLFLPEPVASEVTAAIAEWLAG
jgi:hypothetical protein